MEDKKEKNITKCLCCDNFVEDYEPDFCCSGFECGCQGLPIWPPLCEQCEINFHKNIN